MVINLNHCCNKLNVCINHKKKKTVFRNINKAKSLHKFLLKNNLIKLTSVGGYDTTSLLFSSAKPKFKKITLYKNDNKYTFK